MRAMWPGFTVVEYLFALGVVVLLPFQTFVIALAAAILLWMICELGTAGLTLLYRKRFEPHSGDTHESD
jgi:hypothetical protein